MNEQDLLPLDDELRALVENAKVSSPAPLGAKARVLAGVESVVLPPGGGGSGGPGGQTGHAPTRGSTIGWAQRALPLAAAFGLGCGVGAIAMHALGRAPASRVMPAPSSVVVDMDAPPAPSAPSAPVVGPEPPSPATRATPPQGTQQPAPEQASRGVQSALNAERVVLDVARGALSREDGAAALASTNEHERRFPNGLLAQEREAMAVRALAMLGRESEASARVERFRARFPDSLLLPALESSVRAGARSSK